MRCCTCIWAEVRRALVVLWHWSSLAADWRRPPYPVYTADYATYVQIVTWFLDTPSPLCPFSVHRMALVGKDLGKDVGQWFGPSTAAGAIKCVFFFSLRASAVVKAHYSRADSALPRSPLGPLYITSLTLASGSQWLRTAHSTNPMFMQHRGLPYIPQGDMGTVAWSGATARFWYSLASVSVSKE